MDFPIYIRVLQILCAVWFIPHLLGKIRHFSRAQGTFEAAGLKPGKLFILIAIGLELVAVIGLGLGIQTAFAATSAACALFGAAYAVVRINGVNWRWQNMGPEYPIFWAIVCLVAGFG